MRKTDGLVTGSGCPPGYDYFFLLPLAFLAGFFFAAGLALVLAAGFFAAGI